MVLQRVVGFQALVCTPYRHDVNYSVFDVKCFPFHVAVPCCTMVCRFNFDFSVFAYSWNQDVVAAEQDELAGLQER